jgi:hypothetical protein
MGLLNISPEYSEQVITRSLITTPRGLNFDPFPSLPETHFRKDIFVGARNLNLFGVALIKIPGDFKDGDEIELSITFHEGYIYRGGLKYENLKGKMQPIRYKGSLYEYIQKVLSVDYITNHIMSTIGD